MPRRTRDLRLCVCIRSEPKEVYRALTSARELCVWWLDRAETDARNMGRWRMEWPGQARRAAAGVFVDLEPARKVALIEDEATLPRGVPPLATVFIEPKGRGSVLTFVQAGFSAPKPFEAAGALWSDGLAKLKLYLETGRVRKGESLALPAPAKA